MQTHRTPGLFLWSLMVAFPGCGDGPGATDPDDGGHSLGADCRGCHFEFDIAGTVWATPSATRPAPGTPVVLTTPTGSQLAISPADPSGNFHSSLIPDGTYRIQVGERTSRTWHDLPAQRACNTCHTPGGGMTGNGTRTMHDLHTALPADNDCRHCHHYPATMSLAQLKSPGVLSASVQAPGIPGSKVAIGGTAYEFDPAPGSIATARPDIFAPGYFSMFDAILAVAAREGIDIDYHFDAQRQTHFIDTVAGAPGNYWYHFSYDAGDGNEAELEYRRAYRWDEALWRPGVWVMLVEGENLDEIKTEYLEEIQREHASGHVIPEVTITLNPSSYRGNPPESHRITVSRRFTDVRVTPHGLRSTGYTSPYSKPFQPDVVTSMDILLSLRDQGELDLVTGVFYDRFGGHYIDSYYVVALGFPGVGLAHSSGRHGFVYVTNNGTRQRLPNNADRKFHMTSDISVVHAPDFSNWRWIELGNPYYEDNPLQARALARSIVQDYAARDRGASLHRPTIDADGAVRISWIVFDPGRIRITVQNSTGKVVESLHDRMLTDLGQHELVWRPGPAGAGDRLALVLEHGPHRQIRNLPALAVALPFPMPGSGALDRDP